MPGARSVPRAMPSNLPMAGDPPCSPYLQGVPFLKGQLVLLRRLKAVESHRLHGAGRHRAVTRGPGGSPCLGLTAPRRGAVGYGASAQRSGAGEQEAALMSARCWGETVSTTRDAAGGHSCPDVLRGGGGWMPGAPSVKGPGHDSASPLRWAVGSGGHELWEGNRMVTVTRVGDEGKADGGVSGGL